MNLNIKVTLNMKFNFLKKEDLKIGVSEVVETIFLHLKYFFNIRWFNFNSFSSKFNSYIVSNNAVDFT